jgi:hypothetical protein
MMNDECMGPTTHHSSLITHHPSPITIVMAFRLHPSALKKRRPKGDEAEHWREVLPLP